MFGIKKTNKSGIYLDHAAATPLDPRVLVCMRSVEEEHFANPGGLHRLSLSAKKVGEQARKQVSELLGTRPEEIIFTRGGTESNALALSGVLHAYTTTHVSSNDSDSEKKLPHIITSVIEHAVVRDMLRAWRDEGKIVLTEISVDTNGVVNVKELKESLRPETILVSVMYANNEVGSVQPLREIAKTIRHYRKEQRNQYPLLHTDAIQATNYLDMHMPRLGFDLVSMSGSKIYGPKSTAILFKKSGIPFVSPLHGGDQEFGVRPGTEDVAGMVGFAEALRIVEEVKESEYARLKTLQEYFFLTLTKNFSQDKGEFRINGSVTERLPNNVHISFPNISGERLVIELDARNICASAKSACQSDNERESHVIEALYNQEKIEGSEWGNVRFSLGRSTTQKDIDSAIHALVDIIAKIKMEQGILGS